MRTLDAIMAIAIGSVLIGGTAYGASTLTSNGSTNPSNTTAIASPTVSADQCRIDALTGYGIALNGVDNSNETSDQLNQTLADCAANAPVAVPTIDSNVNDGSTQCATAVLAQYGISPTDALTLTLNGSNPDLMNALMACGADSVGTQADATATESNWLIQQLKELSNE